MAYKSSKESKKLVGGLLQRRTVVILIVGLLAFVYYPTIRNWATTYDAMVVEKIDSTLDFYAKKGRVQHADFKEVILCDAKGKEFEKVVANAVYDSLKEGMFVEKKYMEDTFKAVPTVPAAETLKQVCTIHPPKPKPEPKKQAGAATVPAPVTTPAAVQPIVPQPPAAEAAKPVEPEKK